MHAPASLSLPGGYTNFYDITASLEVLDLSVATPAWVPKAPLPGPRGDLSCATINGLLYVFGGYYDPFCAVVGVGCFNTTGDPRAGAGAVDGVSNFRTETWSYDPSADAWTARAPMRYGRADAAAAALPNGRIVVAGGEHNLRTTAVKVPQHSVEMYHATDDTWAEKAPLPNARFRFAAAGVGQSTYAFGGQAICADNTGAAGVPVASCQMTAANTVSVFFELDHADVFLQLRSGTAPPLTYDSDLLMAAYEANVSGF
jgi:hypothetical protein